MAANFAFLFMMAIWAAAELALVVWMRATDPSDRHHDNGTLPLVIVAIAAALGGGAWLTSADIAAWPASWVPALRWFGASAIAIGLAIRWTAVFTLRHYFTVTVAIRADHKLVDWGLYRYVRHPSYSGAIVALAGLSLGSGGPLSAAAIFLPILWAVLRRIDVEERALGDGLGADYVAWRERTPRLVPRVPHKIPR